MTIILVRLAIVLSDLLLAFVITIVHSERIIARFFLVNAATVSIIIILHAYCCFLVRTTREDIVGSSCNFRLILD